MAMTQAELEAIIAEIDVSISAALKSQSYTMDSGQSRQTVTRQSLTELKQLRDEYQNELDDLLNPSGGIMAINNTPYR